MAISDEDVLHVARLARLTLSDAEVTRAAEQLSAILGHVDALRELELSGVPPTAHALQMENVTRPDKPRPSWPRDEVLAGARRAGRDVPGATDGRGAGMIDTLGPATAERCVELLDARESRAVS